MKTEKTITGETLLNQKIEKLPYLVEGLIPRIGLSCLAGSSDTGKSSLLRQLAIHICSGKEDFLGFTLNTKHKSVLYISTEDDSTAMSYLLNYYAHIIKPEELRSLKFMFDTTNYFETIDEELKQRPVDLIIIDAFTDLFGGQLNAANEVRRYLNHYSNIAERYNCAIILLHHIGKQKEERIPSKSNLIGSQGIEGKMRLVMELRKDLTKPECRHLCIVKGNYLPEEEKQLSHMLRFENMMFKNTDMRVPFEDLVPDPQVKSIYPKEISEKIQKLLTQNVPYRSIAEQITKEGYKMSKSTVGNIAKDRPPVQLPIENVDNGHLPGESQDSHENVA